MKLSKFFASVFVAGSLCVNAASYADLETNNLGVNHWNATFGCHQGKYTVRLDNYFSDVETCNVACSTHFHNEVNQVVVRPYSYALVYGSFGKTTTTCDVMCDSPYYGLRTVARVSGSCLL